MNRILIIDTSYPINSRNQRILDSLILKYGIDNVRFVAWNRDNREVLKMHSDMYIQNQVSPYGNRLRKVLSLLNFYKYIKASVDDFQPEILIASHWDSLFLAQFLKTKYRKIVYENLDLPTFSNKFILFCLQKLEAYSLRKVNLISFASRFYPPLYSSYKIKKIVLENKVASSVPFLKTIKRDRKCFLLTFIGNIRYSDILENVINVVKDNSKIQFVLHGEGPDYKYLKMKYADIKNVIFTGKYRYEDVASLFQSSDVVWAAYPSKDHNVKYAISNKYHESIYYGVPCIYAVDTLLGNYVKQKKLGYVVDPYNLADIKQLLYDILNGNETCLIKENLLKEKIDDKNWEEEIKPFISEIEQLFDTNDGE